MKWIFSKFRVACEKKIPGEGLALFRILFGVLMFLEVTEVDYFRELLYSDTPFIGHQLVNFHRFLFAWQIILIFFIFGLFTRVTALLNYLFGLVVFSVFHKFEYHLDYSLTSLSFLSMIAPMAQTYSLDNLLKKIKYSRSGFDFKPDTRTPQIYYFIFMFMGIAIIYFDSIFYKLASSMWMNGLGMWLPASLPENTWLDLSFILNIKFLSLGMGFLTLVFETVFIFTFFLKKWRFPLFIVGLGLHIGIVVAFPIPWFGLGVVFLYVLLLPAGIWQKIFNKFRFKAPKLTIFYDENCPMSNRMRLFMKHVDAFNALDFKKASEAGSYKPLEGISESALKNGLYAIDKSGNVLNGLKVWRKAMLYQWLLFPFGVLLYIPGLYHLKNVFYTYYTRTSETEPCTEAAYDLGYAPAPVNWDKLKVTQRITWGNMKSKLLFAFFVFLLLNQFLLIFWRSITFDGVRKIPVINHAMKYSLPGKIISEHLVNGQKYLGLTSHPVFMDVVHFDGYNHIIAVVYKDDKGKETYLPMINEKGQAGYYAFGRRWVNWTFRTNNKDIDMETLKYGLMRYSAFWMGKHNKNFDNTTLYIKVKKIDTPKKWEYNFLRNQMAKPWIDAGTIEWKNKQFTANIPDIETL